MVLAGLIAGFTVGVALVAGFQYVMHRRNRKRLQKVPLCLFMSSKISIWCSVPRCSGNSDCSLFVILGGANPQADLHTDDSVGTRYSELDLKGAI